MLLDTGMASNDNKGYVRWQRHYSYSFVILAIILLVHHFSGFWIIYISIAFQDHELDIWQNNKNIEHLIWS